MFVIYINDLPDIVNSSMLLFADDTKIYHPIQSQNDQENLQNDIDEMSRWSDMWLLKFHPDKCKVMTIESDHQNQYTINNHPLEHVEEEKDLGVIIDNELSFETHMSSKVNITNKIMGIIRKSFTYI